MLWLKRNLFLIIGVLVALGLLALAAVYLISRINSDRQATTDLAEQKTALETLVGSQPSLSDENINATKAETAKIEQVAPQLKPLLVEQPVTQLDNVGYKSLLENTISQLQQEAESTGVTLPARYSFTFAAQRPVLNFPSNAIPLLSVQLNEIKTLCSILFKSKIHSLDGLRRVRVYAEEPQGSADYIERKMILTNGLFTVTPYEVVFRGFTAELSQVLDSLQRAPLFFVVKKIQMETMAVAAPPPPPPPPPTNTLSTPSRPARTPPGKSGGVPTNAAPAQTTLVTVMDEKPLRITLALEVVKLIPGAK